MSRQSLVVYALVRVLSYGVLGFAVGLVGAVILREWLALQARTLAICFAGMILVWALIDFLRGVAAFRKGNVPLSLSTFLGKGPFQRNVSWFLALPLPTSVALGIATAVLPCGFLAAAYVQAALLSHPLASALAMMGFAIATSPALLAGAFLSLGLKKIAPRYASIVASLLLIVASVFLLRRAGGLF